MGLVRLAFGTLCCLIAAPPLLGIVIPFAVNVLLTSFLIIYIGAHMSMDAGIDGEEQVQHYIIPRHQLIHPML